MRYISKQFTGELKRNRIFLVLIQILAAFTPFMYYFVHFSLDGNVERLQVLPELSGNQKQYLDGMLSNEILARYILLSFLGLTGFVLGMFFYRFFQAERRQFGCFKALGCRDSYLRGYFMLVTLLVVCIGTAVGLAGGYFASDVLIDAGKESYMVSGILKEIHIRTLLIGFFVPLAVYEAITVCMYRMIQGKESGILLAGGNENGKAPAVLKAADRIARCFPVHRRLPVRLALRKPISVLLAAASVCCFVILFVLAYSLNLSSGTVFRSQTEGHPALYETRFHTVKYGGNIVSDSNTSEETTSVNMQYNGWTENHLQFFLNAEGNIEKGGKKISKELIGLEPPSAFLTLQDEQGKVLKMPEGNQVVIGKSLQELYGFQKDDTVTVRIGKRTKEMRIADIAWNAGSNCIYMKRQEMAELLSLPEDAFTGIWSNENILTETDSGEASVVSREQKIKELGRAAVSNKSSAVINQLIGCVIGCILMYLALLLNYQDSKKDILILYLMGYHPKEISRMLLDIYRPILWISFGAVLIPAILGVKMILRSLSIQIGDYMPFQTNVWVLAGIILLVNLCYQMVRITFCGSVKRMIADEEVQAELYE